ncbi:MAG: LysM peptidoglycan-binding domain-containing protein [Gammaproteobacteria bacterium]|nr:LysM peptidoglycan-binding domain-containing protein [Gammaproteobacteria bacterium]NHN36015.1 LysM peptidoglycan-binding domain-containing protein [Pseudomaricurvus alcaniphilus]
MPLDPIQAKPGRRQGLTISSVIFAVILVLAGCSFNDTQSAATDASRAKQLAQTLQKRKADRLCQLPNDHADHYQEPDYKSLWNRLRSGYQLADIDHPEVDKYIDTYVRHPDYLPRVSRRSAPFLYHIVNELEQRGMPLEIALLPVVESAFDPFAYSHGRAAGLWQFIPGTGLQYGLKQNWWYDGRRDFLAATNAALDYLSDLHRRLDGDWLLALAAYNSGEGNVRKAIRKNLKRGKGTDFWSLQLPRETEAYVPQLLAVSRIVLDPQSYQLELEEIPNQAVFETVDTGSQIDLAQAASMAGISMDELYQLNAGFNRWATDPAGPHRLLIPIENADNLRAQLAQSGEDRVSWERYRVKSGDSLISIASRHKTTVAVLKENNKISGNMIRAGQMLLIPSASLAAQDYSLSKEQRLLRTQSRASGPQGSRKITYTVNSGDSLWSIAKTHKVKVSQLAKWNGMAPRDTLKLRQKLVIWTPLENTVATSGTSALKDPLVRKLAYTVRNGDSLAAIAGKFNLKVQDISRWNSIDQSSYIHPGQSLTLYVDVTRTTSRN